MRRIIQGSLFSIFLLASTAFAAPVEVTIYVKGRGSNDAEASVEAAGNFKEACQNACQPECTYVPYTVDTSGKVLKESKMIGGCTDNNDDGKVRASGLCICDCGSGKNPTVEDENKSCDTTSIQLDLDMVERIFAF